MKKFLLLVLVFVAATYAGFSCDFCNCYLGLNPHYKKNSFGIRYHYRSYIGTHEDELQRQQMGMEKKDFWETRTTTELHGQWYPTQKLKIILSAPFIVNSEGVHNHDDANATETHTHTHTLASGNERTSGIGDPLIIAHHQIFNQTGDSLNFSHRLLAGGGVKFPLGKWKLENGEDAHEVIHKPGSGSWDYLLSAEYLAKYKHTGINVNATYLLASSNKQFYQFGNRININTVCYYQIRFKEKSLYPSLGAYFEQASTDTDHHMPVENSGGNVLYAHAGADFYYKNFCIHTAFQKPVMQDLNSPQPEAQYRLIGGLTYAFD